jgi:hypothetical protein
VDAEEASVAEAWRGGPVAVVAQSRLVDCDCS